MTDERAGPSRGCSDERARPSRGCSDKRARPSNGCSDEITTITIILCILYFIHPGGKLKLSFDRTTKNISQ